MDALFTVLTVLGAGLQAYGFYLAFQHVREVERALHDYRHTINLGASVASIGLSTVTGELTVEGKRRPLSKRVEVLEGSVDSLHRTLSNTRDDLEEKINVSAGQAATSAMRTAEQETARLADTVARISAGKRDRRGIALFVVGLACQTLAAVLP